MPARFDSPSAPHDQLLEMRRTTAHFARKLSELSDDDIAKSADIRRSIAEISLSARLLAHAAKAFGQELTDDEACFVADVPLTASLPVHALRHLFVHSALHLNIELRDLDPAGWEELSGLPAARARRLQTAINVIETKHLPT